MKKLLLIFLYLFCVNNSTNLNEQVASSKPRLTLVHTYHFEKGYTNNFMTASNQKVALSCPNLRKIYIVNANTYKIRSIQYTYGRGPGEIIRGPFGLDFDDKDHLLYLADPDGQRFSVFDFKDASFRTKLFRADKPMYGINNYKGRLSLVSISSSPNNIEAAVLYDPKKQKVIRSYNYPEKSNNPFKYSGMEIATENYIIHASWYNARLYIWNRLTANYIRTSKIVKVSHEELTGKRAKLGRFSGMVPPQHPPLKIDFVETNPFGTNRVFILMKSKDHKYKSNYVYDYDFMKDKVVSKYRLPAAATLLASTDKNLFVYSKEKNVLYQYKLAKK